MAVAPPPEDRELRARLRKAAFEWSTAVSGEQRRRFRRLPGEQQLQLADVLRAKYVRPDDEEDLYEHLHGRLDEDRRSVVPWIDAAFPLDGADVLELGCGTGSATVALAEQGARVTGLDVDESSLAVAAARCEAYGLDAGLMCANAADVGGALEGRTFDIVIFFAALEHMTLEERLQSMRGSWALVRPGGIWVVTETPNRLWFYDGHTSLEPFFHWLPDDLARLWAPRSRRRTFAADVAAMDPSEGVRFARWGRGASFHEFDLAFGDARELDVVSNKQDFHRRRSPLLFAYGLWSKARRFERMLERLRPDLDPAFFRQYLDIVIRKPAG